MVMLPFSKCLVMHKDYMLISAVMITYLLNDVCEYSFEG